MRLINVKSLDLHEVPSHKTVRYAILSHRWEEDEVTFEEMAKPERKRKKGYQKIAGFCRTIQEELRTMSPEYVWVDTCCIDKRSSAELSEAINSMFKWYEEASRCYVFLSDVDGIEDLEDSVWFKRSWTLQELIAPFSVLFYNRNWKFLGARHELAARISRITGIPEAVFTEGGVDEYSVAQRMSWAADREATRVEDEAYSLMGLFDVNMPMLYGEGEKAFTRLQEEIIKQSDDHSIFAWDLTKMSILSRGSSGLLARRPLFFQGCEDIVQKDPLLDQEGYLMTNAGLAVRFLLIPWHMDIFYAVLDCTDVDREGARLAIALRRTSRSGQYVRVPCIEHGEDFSTTFFPERFLEDFCRVHRSQQPNGIRTLVRPSARVQNHALGWYGFLIERIQGLGDPRGRRSRYHVNDLKESPRDDLLDVSTMSTEVSGVLCKVPNESSEIGVWLRTQAQAQGWGTTGAGCALIPAGQYGIACSFVYEGAQAGDLNGITLGFDWEFRPIVRLQWNSKNRSSKHAGLHGLFYNGWIDDAQTLTQVYREWPGIFRNSSPKVGRQGSCVIRVDQSPFHFTAAALDVVIHLEKKSTPRGQDIWTVDISHEK